MILGEQVKLKVYELSRELNLKDAELLDILANLDIPANSRFSSLNYDQVEKVKTFCRENQGPGIQEKRVGSGIVRRRRKKVAPEVEKTPVVEIPAAAITTEEPSEEAAAEAVPATGEKPEKAAAAGPETGEAPPEKKTETEAEAKAGSEPETSAPVTPEGEKPQEPEAVAQVEESKEAEAEPVEKESEETETKPAKAKSRGARVIGKVALEKLGPQVKGAGQKEKGGDRVGPGFRQRPAAAGQPG
ncbi:MAG: hypothetical protein DRH04_11225, partial [Deltaproteobacteria bacterium]